MLDLICKEINIKVEDFLNFDLNLVEFTPPSFLGIKDEFLMSGGLDNRSTCYSVVQSLYDTSNEEDEDGITMGLLFDHEEIGSESTQGANSRIQLGTLQRILTATNIQDNEL